MAEAEHVCKTCGHTWSRGTNGAHNCSIKLEQELKKAQRELEKLKKLQAIKVDAGY